MRIIISPAKKMKVDTDTLPWESLPPLVDKAELLYEKLRSMSYEELKKLWWEQAEEKFPVGTVVTGKVARLMPYGAFIELGSHIDGLLHVSNYDWDWIEDISKVLKVGDEVEVKVMDFDAENHRITLSRKALIEKPEHVVTRPRTTEE